MEYLKINNTDFSAFVNELIVTKSVNYSAQTNAAGNTVVDYINSKRIVSVGFIPLSGEKLVELLAEINAFNVSLSFMNPQINALETINCIVPESEINYYSIRVNGVLCKAFNVEFIEL